MKKKAKKLNSILYKNIIYKKLFLKEKLILDNIEEITAISLNEGYINTLNLIQNYNPIVKVKTIVEILEKDKFKILDKLLLEEVNYIPRDYLYRVIQDKYIDKAINDNNLNFINYGMKNYYLGQNALFWYKIMESAYTQKNIELFKLSFEYNKINFYKTIKVQLTDTNYLKRIVKKEENSEILRYILTIKEINTNENYLMTLLFENEYKEYIEVLFENKEIKNLILKRFEEIKEQNKYRHSEPIEKVKALITSKNISNF